MALTTTMRLRLFLTALLAAPALAAHGQPPQATEPGAVTLSHDSVFSRYRSFQDQPLASWREANETVHQRGGWRAYAQEKPEPASATPAREGTPTAPTPPAQNSHPHHHGGRP